MEQNRPIQVKLMINKNHARSAVYGSKELHAIINAAGILTYPFDILVPVKTEPALPGMPHYLPIKEIALCSTGTCLPFILNAQEVLLTCTNNPASKLSFEQHCQKYMTKFNKAPNFAYSASYRGEYPDLRQALMENKLIKSVPQSQIGNSGGKIVFTVPAHHHFKPYTPRRNTYKNVTKRQIISKKLYRTKK
jgi:hypothetical protein